MPIGRFLRSLRESDEGRVTDESQGTRAGVFLHWRCLHPDGSQAARAALLGESIQVSASGKKSLGESGVPATRNRVDHARQAIALYREVHDRWSSSEDRRLPEER